MSRSRRFLGGLGLGYLNQAAVMLVGLWLTPFFLRHIGQHDYGLWLAGTVLLNYLVLMDLGIVALLPREIAYATGRGIARSEEPELARITGESIRVVLLQTPLVLLLAVILWFSIPSAWAPLRQPLAVVMFVFALFFPLRVFMALLDGLQDLAYRGWVLFAAWALGAAVTILLVRAGWGLQALAAGWVVNQTVTAGGAFLRLLRRFPEALPRTLPKLNGRELTTYFRRGIWLSVAQVAQTLLSGTDLLILSLVAGPVVAVVYDCTGKLVKVLANQPQLLISAASPAICELKATGDDARLLTVTICLTRIMMTASGLVACVVLAANQRFVEWWVPRVQFGGLTLTALLVAAMLLRHLNVTTVTTLICFGAEKRISATTLCDGLVTVTASVVAIRLFGLVGAPLGSLAGALLVSLPLNFAALGRAMNASPWTVVRSLFPWFWRFLLAACIGIGIQRTGAMASLPGFFAACAGIALVYVALLLPLFLQEPLAQYTRPLLTRWRPVAV